MSPRAVVAIAAGLVIGLFAFAVFVIQAQPLDPEERARRVREAAPRWSSYDEDIKGQIGARPFAEWHGEPAAIESTPAGINVVFDLQGPWLERDPALPILLRDPIGRVHRSHQATRKNGQRIYHFPPLTGLPDEALARFEVRYPHNVRALYLRKSL